MNPYVLPLGIPILEEESRRLASEFHGNGAVHGDAFWAPPPHNWENTGGAAMDRRTHARLLADLSRPASRDFWLRWLQAEASHHDTDWMRDGSRLTSTQSAAVIFWSVKSRVMGGRPLRCLWKPWSDFGPGHGMWTRYPIGIDVGNSVPVVVTDVRASWDPPERVRDHAGWRCYLQVASGPETGDAGKAAADAALLADRGALIGDDGQVTLPAEMA